MEMPGAWSFSGNASLSLLEPSTTPATGRCTPREAQTVFRCCPVEPAARGSQGCLSRECPNSRSPHGGYILSQSPGVGPACHTR